MHKKYILGTALLAFVVSGCGSKEAASPTASSSNATPLASVGNLVKGIYALNDCASPPSAANTKGTVNIIVPKNISSQQIVRSGNAPLPLKAMVNYGPPIPPGSQLTGDSPPFSPNNPTAQKPFDVFLHDTNFSSIPPGFILVRVISRKNDKWTFYEKDETSPGLKNDIHGVAANQASGNAICGRFQTIPVGSGGGNQAGQVAYFYVDIAQVQPNDNAIPFTIMLQEKGLQDAPFQVPILIDPTIDTF